MQNLIKNSSKILSMSVVSIAIALAFGISGVEKTEAAEQTSYFVDVTGNGCGNNCADFYKYLATQGISITSTKNQNTSTSNSTSNNNGTTTRATSTTQSTTRPATSYVQYPYQIYTPFASTTTANTNGYTSATGTINYIQYPYYSYAYFQNPTPKVDSAASGQYPESVYVYHGKDATEQMNKYKKTYTSTSTATKPGTNSGFTITSIIK
jgi:hypothetical protein